MINLHSGSRRHPAAAALPGLVALLALLLGCDLPAPPPPQNPPTVEVQPVRKVDSSRKLHLSGTLQASRSLSLGFATIGTVEKVLVEEGQVVRRGQVLAVLGQRSYKDALGIARATADRAEDAYQRLLPMYENKTLPEIKMVEVKTGRQQARLSVSMARKRVADTVLRAPVAGVVAARRVEPGATATPGLPAFTLVQVKTILAVAPVPEMQVARVKRGAKAEVQVSALGRSVQGTVREIAVIANPLTRTYDVKVELPNDGGDLRVGMIAVVRLALGGSGEVLTVRPAAVRVDARGAPYVYVLGKGRKLEQRRVQVRGFVGAGTALSSGVRAGELVVTSGTPMLAHGMTVRLAGQGAQARLRKQRSAARVN